MGKVREVCGDGKSVVKIDTIYRSVTGHKLWSNVLHTNQLPPVPLLFTFYLLIKELSLNVGTGHKWGAVEMGYLGSY